MQTFCWHFTLVSQLPKNRSQNLNTQSPWHAHKHLPFFVVFALSLCVLVCDFSLLILAPNYSSARIHLAAAPLLPRRSSVQNFPDAGGQQAKRALAPARLGPQPRGAATALLALLLRLVPSARLGHPLSQPCPPPSVQARRVAIILEATIACLKHVVITSNRSPLATQPPMS